MKPTPESENVFSINDIPSITSNESKNNEKVDKDSRMENSGVIKTSIKEMMEIEKLKKEIEHEKKGLDFAIYLVKNLLFFLVTVCACKVILDLYNKSLDLNEYFSLLIPIITTALGYILGKKNL